MKKAFDILRYVHYVLTGVTILAFLMYLVSFSAGNTSIVSAAVVTTYLNFIVCLAFFVPLVFYLAKFRSEIENSPYVSSYVIYIVATTASILLIPLIQTFL